MKNPSVDNAAVPGSSPLSQTELARLAGMVRSQASAAANRIPLLGPVAWLLMQQPATRHLLLSDLEWRVMPPLLLEQSRIYTRDDLPLAFVSWARLSEEVAQRYRRVPHRLSPADWRSGDRLWLVDVVAPFGGVAELMEDLRLKVFPGQAIFQLGQVQDGMADAMDWSSRQATGLLDLDLSPSTA